MYLLVRQSALGAIPRGQLTLGFIAASSQVRTSDWGSVQTLLWEIAGACLEAASTQLTLLCIPSL